MRTDLQRLKRDTDSSRSTIIPTLEQAPAIVEQSANTVVASTPPSARVGAPSTPITGSAITSGGGKRFWFAGIVAGLILVLAGAGFWLRRTGTSRNEISSVAVLPFINASNDPNSEYLSDGLTESLINNLSQIPNLAVMSRSAVFHYKGRDVDPQAVARDLKVEGVVTGRIVQRGDQLIISAELIDGRTNHNLWGDQYDRKLSDILAVQGDITRAISSKLRERLSGQANEVAKGGTNDPEAYQLYLKGRYYWGKRTTEALDKARDYFNQAIDKDPNYALAYVALADYYYALPDNAPIPNAEALPKARAAAERALALDDTLAEPHTVLGGVHESQFEWELSEREYRRAIALNPNEANPHHWYAYLLSQTGRADDAIAEAKRAAELEPLNLKYSDSVAVIYGHARHYDLAIQQYKKTLEMDPNFAPTIYNLGFTYQTTGEYDLWLKTWKKGAQLNNDREDLSMAEETARVYAKSGYRAAIKAWVEHQLQLAKLRYVDPADIAYNYADLGEKDQAFAWLDRAYAEKSNSLGYIKLVPQMDSLRSDPRYAALLKKMGLRQ
jgi:TolB-like protein/Tfp pilus assembly protein PilF